MTVTSFVITLYGQCWRRHLVGQRVVSDASVVRNCLSILACVLVLTFESNNTNLLLRLLIAILRPTASVLLHISNITWPTAWRQMLG